MIRAEIPVEQMQKAVVRLKKRVDQVENFQPEAISSESEASALSSQLSATIEDALIRTFGSDTIEYQRYARASDFSLPISFYDEPTLREIIERLMQSKKESAVLLKAAVSSLEE
ncbi:MAG: hypothetical protein ACU0FH_11640 [Heliomarina sp.]|uniref:hypothetical protein n=1 Tax=Heliomarina sp. TaxID=2917556 RepID=UPI0040588BCF